jgi:hypothetical protein
MLAFRLHGAKAACILNGMHRRARQPSRARPARLTPLPPGCFSGCATIDTHGRPVILYTGVRLRTNNEVGPLPPPDRDLNLPFIESQITAVPSDPGACEAGRGPGGGVGGGGGAGRRRAGGAAARGGSS